MVNFNQMYFDILVECDEEQTFYSCVWNVILKFSISTCSLYNAHLLNVQDYRTQN